MTEYEREAVGHRKTSAGSLYAHDNSLKLLTVQQTTLELIAEHLSELRQVVAEVEATGEENREFAEQAAADLARRAAEDEAEMDRRSALAKEIDLGK